MPRATSSLIPLAVLLLAGTIVFYRLGASELQPFDEARRGTSAIEMAYGTAQHFLVPTYAGAPDHWGTKPPLLIWLQAASVRLFGMTPFAVRLPSALVTLGLIALLLRWCRRDWGGYLPAAVAALYLLSSADYLGNHGARSGDFDALLIFFLVAQLGFIHRYRCTGAPAQLVLFGLSVVLAGYTKGIAGCFFLPGIGLWLLLDRRGRELLTQPRLYLVGLAALALITAYYPLREVVDPGYIAAVRHNELGRRFTLALEGHDGPWYAYMEFLAFDEGTKWLNLLLLPALFSIRNSRNGALTLVAVVAVTYLGVISVAATKIFWYKSPLLPLIGLLYGAGLQHWLGSRSWRGRLGLLAFTGLTLCTLYGSWQQLNGRRAVINYVPAPAPHVAAIDAPNFTAPFTLVLHHYQPNARFHLARSRVQGRSIRPVYSTFPPYITVNQTLQPPELAVGERVAVCTTRDYDYLATRYLLKELARAGVCRLYHTQGTKPAD
ncbi:ArnT family glycosyltransferase [Neolewinella sp.]|uniref:ArnT family glycosyltransferase n=1 Tax=Neolewinella sp. TaxID=2993543 RepID=UPI003B525837